MNLIRSAIASALLLLAVAGVSGRAEAQTQVHTSCTGVSAVFPQLATGRPFSIDENGNTCINGSITASLAGFTPGLTYASLTATGSSASVALPAGATVVFQNTGSTTVSCTLGVGSATATAGMVQVPASSSVPMVVGSNTFGACIDESGSASNVVRLTGGSGLSTGFGGGGGGGGSSSITTWAGGTLGAMANYGTSPGAVLAPGVNAFVTNTVATTPAQATASNLNAQVVGNIASAGTDSGNPVKVGGKVNTTLPAYTDGQRGDLQISGAGRLLTASGTTATSADAFTSATLVFAQGRDSSAGATLLPAAAPFLYNGSTWDRAPGTTLGAYGVIRDAAGNARGANVDASNKLTVSDVTAQGSLATIATNTGSAVPLPTASGNATTGVTCGSAVSSCVLKASTGNLMSAYANCTSACWLMIFNSTTAPSNGATTAGQASGNLVHCIDISAGSSKSISFAMFPGNFSVGITAAISSTACATLTLSTVGFVHGEVL